MVSVIWLVYLAGVVDNLSVALTTGGVFTLLGAGGYSAFYAIEGDYIDSPRKPIRGYVIAAIAALFVATILPSKNVLYAMAALNAGERALQTETGDKAIRALNAWLDKQIAVSGEERGK